MRSDNGPKYSSAEFAKFVKDWGIKHTTSSPKFPSSNGKLEQAVKTFKDLLKKNGDHMKALLSYRSTSLACSHSPAELLMGRKLRTTLPMVQSALAPKWPNLEKLQEQETKNREKTCHSYNKRHTATPLSALKPDDHVYIKDMTLKVQ